MGGISTGTGLFSGIDTRSLIDQLMAVEARPRALAQQRIVQLKAQQAAYLDINTRMSALKTAAGKFRLESVLKTKKATSSDEGVLTAIADKGAALGSYTFRVDRLVSSQQMLTRGFADRNVSGAGLSSLTFESAAAKLSHDVALADLNNGQGVSRGSIVVRDSTGAQATVDLSRVTTIDEVLTAINGSGLAITAGVSGGRFTIKDNAGGAVTVSNGAGFTTATSLGIAGTATGTLTGSLVYGLGVNTSLASLNDGNGVRVKSAVGNGAFNFTINISGDATASVNVNVGDVYDAQGVKTAGAVSTVGGVIDRINAALDTAGYGSRVRASINAESGRIEVNDIDAGSSLLVAVAEGNATTAADLGLRPGSAPTGALQGRRVLAAANSVLLKSLNGGSGVGGDGLLFFTARDGSVFSAAIDPNGSVSDAISAIEAASIGKIRVTLNDAGNGLKVTDLTGGTGTLAITGNPGNDTAAALGIATEPAGVLASVVNGTNLQKQYVGLGTQLSAFNAGKGVGSGRFRVTDSAGRVATVDIGTDSKTLADIVDEINAAQTTPPDNQTPAESLTTRARINAKGDGIEIYDTGTGSQRIKIEDVSGTVARDLRILGTAAGTGVGADNRIDGSLETKIDVGAGDTLDAIVSKINAAGGPATASIIQDGVGSVPFRLTLTASRTGVSGRFLIDTGGVDLGLTSLSRGENARVFFGSGDYASSIAVTSTSNQVDNILAGVKIDLKSTSTDPVTLSVTSDTDTIVGKVKEFIDAFNKVVERVDAQSKYDKDNNKKSPLLGDATIQDLRAELFRLIQSPAVNVSGPYQRLSQVGLKVVSGNKLDLDEQKFRDALSADPEAVERLLAARVAQDDSSIDLGNGVVVTNPNPGQSFTSQGVMTLFENAINRHVESATGTLELRKLGFDNQIKAQEERVKAYDVRLASKRQILERQFTAMEKTLGQLQQQQGALASLAGLGARR